jgi:hypothetical protein
MRMILGMVAAVGLLAATSTTATAQDESDIAAWFAMMFTPYGALPPLGSRAMAGLPPTDGRAAATFEIKYGHWAFDEVEEPWNTFGLGGRVGSVGLTLGYGKCEGCDDGFIMGGLDFESILLRSPFGTAASNASFAVSVRPSLGFGMPTGDGEGNVFAANVDFPLSFTMPVGVGSRFVPFVAPGFGFGRLDDGTDSETGTRAAIAAGVGFLTSGGFGMHLAWRKIFIDEGPSTLGVGVSFGR